MGKRPSQPLLKDVEVQEFVRTTAFRAEQVTALYWHFHRMAVAEKDDGVIDFAEFCSSLKQSATSELTRRVFRLFDANDDAGINFPEFLQGLAALNPHPHSAYETQKQSRLRATTRLNQLITFSFTLFDLRCTGKVYLQEFELFLQSSVREYLHLSLTDAEVHALAQRAFTEAECEEDAGGVFLDLDAYKRLAMLNPHMLQWLTLDLDRVQRSVSKLTTSKRRCLSL